MNGGDGLVSGTTPTLTAADVNPISAGRSALWGEVVDSSENICTLCSSQQDLGHTLYWGKK